MGRTPGAKNKVPSAAGSPRSPRADSSGGGGGGPVRRRLRLPELVSLSLTPYPLSLSTEMIMAMNAEASTIQVGQAMVYSYVCVGAGQLSAGEWGGAGRGFGCISRTGMRSCVRTQGAVVKML